MLIEGSSSSSGTVAGTLTEEEAALYDRQIRLWGLEAQNRLRKARVLLLGMSGLACEIAKNITLAGLHSLTLADDRLVTEADLRANFLLQPGEEHRNRAVAAVAGTQALNQMVHVSALDHLPSWCLPHPTEECDCMPNPADQYDAVICALDTDYGNTGKIWSQLGRICRAGGIQLFVAQVFGRNGLCFLDLGTHDFVVEEQVLKKPASSSSSSQPPPAKMARSGDDVSDKHLVKKTMQFCSLAQLETGLNWSKLITKNEKRTVTTYFTIKVVQEFVHDTKRHPREDDVDDLVTRWLAVAKEAGLDSSLVTSTDFRLCCGPAMAPVNAIVGGLLAQEVIKGISKKGAPVGNLIFFCGGDSCAAVDHLLP